MGVCAIAAALPTPTAPSGNRVARWRKSLRLRLASTGPPFACGLDNLAHSTPHPAPPRGARASWYTRWLVVSGQQSWPVLVGRSTHPPRTSRVGSRGSTQPGPGVVPPPRHPVLSLLAQSSDIEPVAAPRLCCGIARWRDRGTASAGRVLGRWDRCAQRHGSYDLGTAAADLHRGPYYPASRLRPRRRTERPGSLMRGPPGRLLEVFGGQDKMHS